MFILHHIAAFTMGNVGRTSAIQTSLNYSPMRMDEVSTSVCYACSYFDEKMFRRHSNACGCSFISLSFALFVY